MVGLAKKTRKLVLTGALGVTAMLVVASCEAPTGVLPGGPGGLDSVLGEGVGGPGAAETTASLDIGKPSVDPLADVPAIPTRADAPVSEAGPLDEENTTADATGRLGPVTDVTAEVFGRHGGNPEADTMAELADLVVDLRDGDGATQALIGGVEFVPGRAGSEGAATMRVVVDRLGVPDDSVLGEQLVVHARSTPDGEAVELVAVERRVICRFGATPAGRCL